MQNCNYIILLGYYSTSGSQNDNDKMFFNKLLILLRFQRNDEKLIE